MRLLSEGPEVASVRGLARRIPGRSPPKTQWTAVDLACEDADLAATFQHTQLRHAGPLAADRRKPWEKATRPGTALTPTRVRRGFRSRAPLGRGGSWGFSVVRADDSGGGSRCRRESCR